MCQYEPHPLQLKLILHLYSLAKPFSDQSDESTDSLTEVGDGESVITSDPPLCKVAVGVPAGMDTNRIGE